MFLFLFYSFFGCLDYSLYHQRWAIFSFLSTEKGVNHYLSFVRFFLPTEYLLKFVDAKDINLRLNSLPPPPGSTSTKLSLSTSPNNPAIVLSQLVTVRDLIDQSLDVVDVSTYTGDPLNANFIYGQMRLLRDNLSEARQALKGDGDQHKSKWWEDSVNEDVSLNLHFPLWRI